MQPKTPHTMSKLALTTVSFVALSDILAKVRKPAAREEISECIDSDFTTGDISVSLLVAPKVHAVIKAAAAQHGFKMKSFAFLDDAGLYVALNK